MGGIARNVGSADAASGQSPIQVEKRCRLLVSTDDESLSVVAVHSNIAFNFVNSSWMLSCTTVEA